MMVEPLRDASILFDLTNVTLLGLPLSSYRDHTLDPSETSTFFEYEAAIAAISIFFFRTTVIQSDESTLLRYFFAFLLAGLAYFQKSYELVAAVQLFSYAAARQLSFSRVVRRGTSSSSSTTTVVGSSTHPALVQFVSVLVSGISSLAVARFVFSRQCWDCLQLVTPSIVIQFLSYLFPVAELQRSYEIASAFLDPTILNRQLYHLLFVTFHIQCGMGFLGIEFLRREQHRRNQLVRMDIDDSHNNKNETEDESRTSNGTASSEPTTTTMTSKEMASRMRKARRFQKSAGPFILGTALPYMMQLVVFGGMNKYSFICFQHDMHRTIRLHELFDHDSHLLATATESTTSPEAYANSMDVVLGTSYDFFNRKLFSLPKVLLLPAVMAKQPWLVVQVLPFILMSDYVKASAVAFLTNKIEAFQKEMKELSAIRSKVEAYDMKNAGLLLRSGKGSTLFTHRKWERLTVQIQAREVVSALLSRSKDFFAFMQRNFVFGVLIDCALASLLALGKITSTDTFVFSRAVEDTVDMILTRSRAEAELARMTTEQTKLWQLQRIFEQSKQRMLLPCTVPPPSLDDTNGPLVIRNLHYTRGTVSVRVDHIEIEPGVHALTGANGSGKSTFFRVLMGCDSNEKPIDIPSSINLLTPSEPLVEKDDVERDLSCEAGHVEVEQQQEQDADTEQSDDTVATSASSCETDETASVDGSNCLANPNPVPRLSVTMPSSNVSEISQDIYWPLFSKPIEFFYQGEEFDLLSSEEIEERALRVATELHSLEFFQPVVVEEGSAISSETASIERIANELKVQKEDWFGDLSGGQKSKAELVRKVFLRGSCPAVLLVDETMAPLDPASKSRVMKKLKDFCRESIVIVIYHPDAQDDKTTAESNSVAAECVPSNGFFDHNLHLEKGTLHLRPTC